MRTSGNLRVFVLFACVSSFLAAPAAAEGPIDIGGKFAATVQGSLTSTNIQDTTIVSGALDGSYITPGERFEFGAGILVGAFITDDITVAVYTPRASARVNSNFLGAEENWLLYVGGNLGVTIVDIDAGDFDETDEEIAGGPKIGAEYYFTPSIAVQLEDSLFFFDDPLDEEDPGIRNILSLGVKFVF